MKFCVFHVLRGISNFDTQSWVYKSNGMFDCTSFIVFQSKQYKGSGLTFNKIFQHSILVI